ncbi:MAG: DMT family transporter, partial [Treponema sp.]|nr:DMT family transporter [Treponema sp.]
MNRNVKGQWAIVVCAVLWSTSGLFIKIVNWHPLIIAGLRSFIAALFMTGMGRIRRGSGKKGKAQPGMFWGAAISYALTMILFVIANKHTASANAILLQYSAPIWAAIFGWALAGERPYGEHWAALGAVIIGLLLFFKDGLAGGSFWGDCVAILSGIAFGLHSVFMRLQKEGDPADALILSHWITAAACIPFLFIAPPELSAPNCLAIVFMGIIQIGAASLLFSYGIRRVKAIQAMLTAVVEPVLNPLWVLAVTG